MIDWLDPAEAVVQNAPLRLRTGGPRSKRFPAPNRPWCHTGKATVSLKPWGTMILAPATLTDAVRTMRGRAAY